jgi:hypothetical protein
MARWTTAREVEGGADFVAGEGEERECGEFARNGK